MNVFIVINSGFNDVIVRISLDISITIETVVIKKKVNAIPVAGREGR
jgi:hypothetical protein